MSLLSFAEVAMLVVSIGYQAWQIIINPAEFEEDRKLFQNLFSIGTVKEDLRIKKMEVDIHVSISHMKAKKLLRATSTRSWRQSSRSTMTTRY